MILLTVSAAHIRFLLRVLAAFYADTSFLPPLIPAALKHEVGLIALLAPCSPFCRASETMHADAVLPAKWAEYLAYRPLPHRAIVVPALSHPNELQSPALTHRRSTSVMGIFQQLIKP